MKRTSTMSVARANRGMSILEVLIAGALVFLLVSMAAQFVVPALGYTHEGAIKVELQQAGILAVNSIVGEMQKTTTTGVSRAPASLPTDTVVLAVNRIATIDSNGFPAFESKLLLFWWNPSEGRLRRKEFPPSPPANTFTFSGVSPVSASISELRSIATQTNGTERNLAPSVVFFAVDDEGGGRFVVRLSLRKDIPNTPRKAEVELSRKVFLRNS